jgi:hypothetical protein
MGGMDMKKLSLMLFMLFSVYCFAQDYQTGIGLRGGYTSGITFKHFISEAHAFEVIVGSRWRGVNITGLYEFHRPAFEVEGLNWFYGGGAHIGVFRGYSGGPWDNFRGEQFMQVGVDGIVGLEYKIPPIPISLSFDIKPMLSLYRHTGFFFDSAFSARYVF